MNMSEVEELRAAAAAVVARWDTPMWRHETHTAELVDRLRKAIATNPAIATYQPSGNSGELATELAKPVGCNTNLANSSNYSSSSNSPEIEGIAERDFDKWFEREYPRDGDRRPRYQQSGVMDLMRAAWSAARSIPFIPGMKEDQS